MIKTILITVLVTVIAIFTAYYFMFHNLQDMNSSMNHCMGNSCKNMGSNSFEMGVPNLEAIDNNKFSLGNNSIFNLTADVVSNMIGENNFTMYAYNQMIPGPLLEVEKGSTIYINFTNNLPEKTTIHWHGLRHDIKFDGVPGVSQNPVLKGESFLYELNFPDSGLFWYHPHIREDRGQDLGLTGAILVKDTNEIKQFNREEVLVIDDILIRNNNIVVYGEDHASFAMMGRYGNQMLVNGKTNYSLDVKNGEVIRFHIVNVANARPYNLSFDNLKMKLIGSDLSKYEFEEFVESVIISPGERYTIDVYFNQSSNLLNINPHKKYVMGEFNIEGDITESFKDEFLITKENFKVREEILELEKYFNKSVDYYMDLTLKMDNNMDNMPCHVMFGMIMGKCSDEQKEELRSQLGEVHGIEWEDEMQMGMSANMLTWQLKDRNTGKTNMDFIKNAKVGDKIKISIFNDPNSMHPMQHPIHLHGQRFIVTHINGVENENKVFKDTVLVKAGDKVDILIDVTNPGEWMLHCHIAEHLETGMMSSLIVE